MKLLQKTYPLIKMFWGLPRVQCTKNRLVCKNYIANYTFFSGASTKFHDISSISKSNLKLQEISRSCIHPVISARIISFQASITVSIWRWIPQYVSVAASEVLCVFWRMAGWHRTSTVQRPVRRGSRWWKNAALSDCCMYWRYLYSLPLDLPSVLWYC